MYLWRSIQLHSGRKKMGFCWQHQHVFGKIIALVSRFFLQIIRFDNEHELSWRWQLAGQFWQYPFTNSIPLSFFLEYIRITVFLYSMLF